MQPAVVVWGGPAHCVSDGSDAQLVSLQELAAPVLDCPDLKSAAAAALAEGGVAGLLAARPNLTISLLSVDAMRSSCPSVYTAAAGMEPPLDAALSALLHLRALSTTLRGVAQLFSTLGDGSWTASNGLSVWTRGKLCVVSLHPNTDKDVSVVGKAFGPEVAKVK